MIRIYSLQIKSSTTRAQHKPFCRYYWIKAIKSKLVKTFRILSLFRQVWVQKIKAGPLVTLMSFAKFIIVLRDKTRLQLRKMTRAPKRRKTASISSATFRTVANFTSLMDFKRVQSPSVLALRAIGNKWRLNKSESESKSTQLAKSNSTYWR